MMVEKRAGEIPQWLQAATALLSSDSRVEAAFLLGSAARGVMRPDSDVDIAVLPVKGCRMTDLDTAALGADLAFAMGKDVDVGVLSSRNLVYAREAIMTGVRFFARNPVEADAASATLLGMYAVFNTERKEVLDAYCA